MPVSTLIAPALGPANSADFIVLTGERVSLWLIVAGGGQVPSFSGMLALMRKDANGNYTPTNKGLSTMSGDGELEIEFPGTYRIASPQTSVPVGVAYDNGKVL